MTTQKSGLTIHTLEQQAMEAAASLSVALTADRRLWLDATQTQVVEDGDPAARFQLAAPGHRIPVAEAKRLRLYNHEGRIEQAPAASVEPDESAAVKETPTVDEKQADAKARQPKEDKKRTPAENK